MNSHAFNPTILREYDIRGVVGHTLTMDDARALGRAFGTVAARRSGKKGPTISVGYDGRVSSPGLEAALVDGLMSTGAKVLRVGLGPTPLMYFSVFHLKSDAGIMVTGSHNPGDQNGFKLMLGRLAFYGPDITALGELAAKGDFVRGQGSVEDRNVGADYVAELVRAYRAPAGKSLKVTWDPGNGAAGEFLAKVAAQLPGQHQVINQTVDGTFPSHHPDPSEEKNLKQLQDAVRKEHCDVGLAFDGDGDRLGVVDANGRTIPADMMLALLAREVLKDRPGATIIADVKSSQVLYDEIARLGGKPLMWKTGHAHIKTKLAEEKSPLAGELSGHLFFADRYYGFDDALYAGVRVLSMVASSGQSLSAMAASLPAAVNTPEIRVACPDDQKFRIVQELRERMRKQGAKVSELDGLRVSLPTGWWLLRASNTQPALVARIEAVNAAELERLRSSLDNELKSMGVTLTEHHH